MRDIKNTIRVDVTFPHDTSHQVKMVTEDFREFIQLFDEKNREYGSENAFVLGSAGQFADIWRKIGKLKTALWDRKPEQLTSEGTEEIVQDLIGHLFLTLQCLRKEGGAPRFGPAGPITAVQIEPQPGKVEPKYPVMFKAGDRVIANSEYHPGKTIGTVIWCSSDRHNIPVYRVEFDGIEGSLAISQNELEKAL